MPSHLPWMFAGSLTSESIGWRRNGRTGQARAFVQVYQSILDCTNSRPPSHGREFVVARLTPMIRTFRMGRSITGHPYGQVANRPVSMHRSDAFDREERKARRKLVLAVDWYQALFTTAET